MEGAAVTVRGACMKYGKGKGATDILKNLNMTVREGTIYGLLGASGCGKTTLLSSVVGRRKLNSGEILVFGSRPGSPGSGVPGSTVGYMLQDTALLGEFSVKDAVLYFGWLYNMSNRQIEERYQFLHSLLNLPSDGTLIKNLSGGQQRRVSFAVSVVHRPKLLILDEPTVGQDSILRDSIWKHLLELTAGGDTTVIITTHYIDEAIQSNTVGLMRNGMLLVEEPPSDLISRYACATLEEVFVILSARQEQVAQENEPTRVALENSADTIDNLTDTRRTDTTVSQLQVNDAVITSYRLKALLFKNYLVTKRNFGGFLFTMFLPILSMLVFFNAIGRYPDGIQLVVVNDELHNLSTCEEYKQYYNIGVYNNGPYNCHFSGVGCLFLNKINDSLAKTMYVRDRESAMSVARTTRNAHVLYIPANFSRLLQQRIDDEWIIAQDPNFEDSEIHFHLDMSDAINALSLKSKLVDVYKEFSREIIIGCNITEKHSQGPVTFSEPVFGVSHSSYTTFVTPGFINSLAYFVAVTLTATSIVTEKSEGLWERNLVAGTTPIEMILSHLLCQAVCVLIQVTEILAVSQLGYHVLHEGDLASLSILVLAQGLCGTCSGLLISSIVTYLPLAILLSFNVYVILLYFCGSIWPMEGMPTALYWICMLLPESLSNISVRNILEKGWTLRHPGVYPGFLMTLAWIVGQLLLSYILIKSDV